MNPNGEFVHYSKCNLHDADFGSTFKLCGVEETTAKEFDNAFRNKFGLLWVYAEWCGHCKAMKEEYAKVPDKVWLEFGDRAVVAAMNAEDPDNKAFMRNHGVTGFPTVFMVRNNGSVKRYEGPRNTDAFVKAVRLVGK